MTSKLCVGREDELQSLVGSNKFNKVTNKQVASCRPAPL